MEKILGKKFANVSIYKISIIINFKKGRVDGIKELLSKHSENENSYHHRETDSNDLVIEYSLKKIMYKLFIKRKANLKKKIGTL